MSAFQDALRKRRQTRSTTAATAAADDDPRELYTRSAAEIEVLPQEYLVEGKIPVGTLSLVAGEGGLGKSTLVRHIIARLTTGRAALGLDYAPPPPCEVLLASVEDSAATTIVPHLQAEGADLGMVQIVEGIRKPDGQVVQFDLRDYALVRKRLAARPATRLLVLDPIMSFVGRAGANESASAEVRQLLDPLFALAEQTGLAVVMVAHLNKATNTAAVNRIAGTAAFRDICRAVWALGRDPADADRRVLARIKLNPFGADPRSVAFGQRPLDPDEAAAVLSAANFARLTPTQRAKIVEHLRISTAFRPSDADADAVLGTRAHQGGERTGSLRPCAAWLKDRLGTQYAWPDEEIEGDAIEKGYTVRQYRRAKADLKPTLRVAKVGYAAQWRVGFGDVPSMPLRPEQHAAPRSDERDIEDGPDIWPP